MAKTKARIKAKLLKSKKLKVNKALKNKKSAAKRFKVTGTGLIKIPHCGKQHKATSKNRSRKNRLKKSKIMRKESMRHVVRCIPLHF